VRHRAALFAQARFLVALVALGEDRFGTTAPGREQFVVGFTEAGQTEDALAAPFE